MLVIKQIKPISVIIMIIMKVSQDETVQVCISGTRSCKTVTAQEFMCRTNLLT